MEGGGLLLETIRFLSLNVRMRPCLDLLDRILRDGVRKETDGENES